MKYIVGIIIAILTINQSFGQIILSDFDLVKSFQSNQDQSKPAIVSFTIPEDKESSYLVNAAFGVDISGLFLDRNTKLVKLYPNIEYNRNTLVNKKQNQLSSGLAFEWIILTGSKFIPTFTSSAKYSNDYIKKIESFQGDIFIAPKWTGVDPSIKNFYVPDNFVKVGKNGFFGFEYVPYLGAEIENRFNSQKDSLIGDIYRFVFKLETNFYLLPKIDSSNKFQYYYIELNIDYQYRNEFSNSSKDFLSNRNYFKGSLNYTIYKNDNIDAKVGLDYVHGADPTKAFEDQNYYGLSFKLKL
ncbi:MAG TPA: hypothetical protein VIL99_16875 [Ignavibacteria bacterium]